MNNRLSLEVLHARRPTLNYISPAICEATFSGSSFGTLVLEALSGLSPVSGFVVTYDATSGLFRISWDAYPNALCYNLYRDPTGGGVYTLFKSCIPGTTFQTADCPVCFLITAVTLIGETPFLKSVCTDCPTTSANPITYYSSAQTASCPTGYSGSSVTKPAGFSTSLVSQANADAKAKIAAEEALSCQPCHIITDSPLPAYKIGTFYTVTLMAETGGVTQFTLSGSLPPGLTLNASTGVISGTPTCMALGGYEFDITATAT